MGKVGLRPLSQIEKRQLLRIAAGEWLCSKGLRTKKASFSRGEVVPADAVSTWAEEGLVESVDMGGSYDGWYRWDLTEKGRWVVGQIGGLDGLDK